MDITIPDLHNNILQVKESQIQYPLPWQIQDKEAYYFSLADILAEFLFTSPSGKGVSYCAMSPHKVDLLVTAQKKKRQPRQSGWLFISCSCLRVCSFLRGCDLRKPSWQKSWEVYAYSECEVCLFGLFGLLLLSAQFDTGQSASMVFVTVFLPVMPTHFLAILGSGVVKTG